MPRCCSPCSTPYGWPRYGRSQETPPRVRNATACHVSSCAEWELPAGARRPAGTRCRHPSCAGRTGSGLPLPAPGRCPRQSPLGPPTWRSRLQGCPVTTDQAQRRLQTPSRQAGAIWLQETAGQKNKCQGKLGSRPSRLCCVRCGRGCSRTAWGPCRAPVPWPQGPTDHQLLGASPAVAVAPLPPDGCAWVKGGGAGYTLTTTPRHLPPTSMTGDRGTASICLVDRGVLWGPPQWEWSTGRCWGARGGGRHLCGILPDTAVLEDSSLSPAPVLCRPLCPESVCPGQGHTASLS